MRASSLLLKRVYKRWLVAVEHTGQRSLAPTLPDVPPVCDESESLLALHEPEQMAVPHAPLLPIQDGCHAPAASPNANSFGARAGSVENVDSFAAENATTRSLAEDWIDCDPLHDCVLARAIVEPAMAALRHQLLIGSERYERMSA